MSVCVCVCLCGERILARSFIIIFVCIFKFISLLLEVMLYREIKFKNFIREIILTPVLLPSRRLPLPRHHYSLHKMK